MFVVDLHVRLVPHQDEGRVELRVRDNVHYEAVCSDGWSEENTKVLCRQLGFRYVIAMDLHF